MGYPIHAGAFPDKAALGRHHILPGVDTQLLIALFPDHGVQSAIRRHCDDWLWPNGHYFPAGPRLHLTLHCFEDQAPADEMRLRAALAEVPMHPLELMLDRSRTWRNDISVVQPAEHEGLRALHDAVAHAVRRAGIDARWPAKWTPHITIARHTEGAARPPQMEPIRWTATEFKLVRSHLASPMHHELLASYGVRQDAARLH